ncbi:sensor histidine kinase [Streptacidiphilus griseoplanus]|uniref:sensor histidine kinase n=1 Tax=Peterkaempfera griseoplana TaxID=66896 RepID=UPI0006E1D846|nr:ATP-binding protein [Peterkaempfera griseoplana]
MQQLPDRRGATQVRPPGAGRRVPAAVGGAAGLAVLTAVLLPLRSGLSLAGIELIYLAAVVLIAAAGGVWLALTAAVVSEALVAFFFVPPFHTLHVQGRDLLITLVVYVAVAVTVSVTVDLAARQRAAAVHSAVEAALLARITAAPLHGRPLHTVLEHVRDTFGMTGAALLERDATGEHPVGVVGQPPSARPALSAPAGERLRLVADGPAVFAPDQRFLARLATAAARALEAERLADEAARARELAEIDRVRAALLTAVGHDLRTPLAGIKASVSALREPGLGLSAGQQAELLATVEAAADRMGDLVENLLALSRLQAGALSVHPRAVALDEVVAAALLHTPLPAGHGLEVEVPEDLPPAWADPGLLERVIANLVANACRASEPGGAIRVSADAADGRVRLRIADHGPGIPAADRERVFTPFQRLDDQSGGGLGLGLAIARGFTEAMHGSLAPSDTPGGGLTMTLTLPAAV